MAGPGRSRSAWPPHAASVARWRRRALAAGVLAACGTALAAAPSAAPACRGVVYLTLDTGNMSQAEAIAATLARHEVKATFFLASERTPRGDHALDDAWAPYWRARVREGHAFGSHTHDHVYFRSEQAGVHVVRPQFGPQADRTLRWDAAAVCREIDRVRTRFAELTGATLDPWWRAPGGRVPEATLAAARACGWAHVHWAPAGFLGDELPSETHPNEQLLREALRRIRSGDILIAHLGIWSRKDPWAPVLDPLIAGLKARGLCFATLREHPQYR